MPASTTITFSYPPAARRLWRTNARFRLNVGSAAQGVLLKLAAISTGGFASQPDLVASHSVLTQTLTILASFSFHAVDGVLDTRISRNARAIKRHIGVFNRCAFDRRDRLG